jgi:hypothetical protein
MSKQKNKCSSNKEKINANLKREKPMSQGFTLLCNKLYLVSFSYAPLNEKLLSLNHIMGSRLSHEE